MFRLPGFALFIQEALPTSVHMNGACVVTDRSKRHWERIVSLAEQIERGS